MIPFKDTQELEIFLEAIRKRIPYEKDAIMNLLYALVTNDLTKARTVVELTLNKYFKREFSSVFKAIDSYYAPRKVRSTSSKKRKEVRESLMDLLYDKALCSHKSKYSFCLDMTGKLTNHSPKISDKYYIYSNGKIGVGHLYSAICLNAQDSWMLPLSMLRIPSTENKFDFAISQMKSLLKKIPETSLAICVGDAAYCCNKFVHSAYQYKNTVSITRVRSSKTIFVKYNGTQKKAGRKRKYGDKYHLSKDILPEPDCTENFEETTGRGKIQTVKLTLFKDYICRGSKGYKMSDVPTNFLKVEVYNENGTKKYPRDLWLEVVGERKDELTSKQIYMEYKDRFNIEPFFKFVKSKLLMDKFQTIDPDRAEDFSMFGMIAYHLLFYCKNLLDSVSLRKWEKKIESIKTPWQVFRAIANSVIFDSINDPVVKRRGIPTEKNIRKIFNCSPNQPIMHKSCDKSKIEIAIKSSFDNKLQISKTSLNVDPNIETLPLELIIKKTKEICNKIWPQAG